MHDRGHVVCYAVSCGVAYYIYTFYVTTPRLWNALPRNIREAKSLTVFKKMLKSHLYPNY